MQTRRLSAELGRTVGFLRAVVHEHDDPAGLYEMLARDTLDEVGAAKDLRGALLLDVGGGPGYLGEAAEHRGATAVTLDLFHSELTLHGRRPKLPVQGDGLALPIADLSCDVVHCSNVLEHTDRPRRLFDEVVRVTAPDGLIYLSFTNWLSPWGGHETSPWHYLGGERAVRHYQRRHGADPKNRYGSLLFPLHVNNVLRWIRHHRALEVVDLAPRYYPHAFSFLVKVPAVREVATWNLRAILRRVG